MRRLRRTALRFAGCHRRTALRFAACYRTLGLWACLALVIPMVSAVSSTCWAQEGEHGAMTGAEEGHESVPVPVIENWWSWDYGHGKAHKNPPFAFSIINFGVYLFVMYRLAGGSLREFMRGRHHEVRKALDEAATLQKQAQAELDQYQERIRRIDGEVSEMLATVRHEAEAERARIIAAAETQAAHLHKDAEAQVRVEIQRARAELQRAAARAAIDAAEAILRTQVQEGDQKRLVDEYVNRVEALSPPPGGVSGSGRTPGRWPS